MYCDEQKNADTKLVRDTSDEFSEEMERVPCRGRCCNNRQKQLCACQHQSVNDGTQQQKSKLRKKLQARRESLPTYRGEGHVTGQEA